jgi:hypothetical protein
VAFILVTSSDDRTLQQALAQALTPLLANQEKIMTALSDLLAAETAVAAAIASAIADIQTLAAAIASNNGVSAADAEAVAGQLNTLASNLGAAVNPPPSPGASPPAAA